MLKGLFPFQLKIKTKLLKLVLLLKMDASNIECYKFKVVLQKNKIKLRKYFGYNERDFIVAFVGQFNEKRS